MISRVGKAPGVVVALVGHIECSAMSAAHLGETIDIHGGGIDLVFPHHENERAQSVCAHKGAQYVKYWLHNGFVNINKEKNVQVIRQCVAGQGFT